MNCRRLLAGHCKRCGLPWSGPTALCQTCLDGDKAKRANRAGAGLCTGCGAVPPKPGRRLCRYCARGQSERSNRAYRKRAKRPDALNDFDAVL